MSSNIAIVPHGRVKCRKSSRAYLLVVAAVLMLMSMVMLHVIATCGIYAYSNLKAGTAKAAKSAAGNQGQNLQISKKNQ